MMKRHLRRLIRFLWDNCITTMSINNRFSQRSSLLQFSFVLNDGALSAVAHNPLSIIHSVGRVRDQVGAADVSPTSGSIVVFFFLRVVTAPINFTQ